MRAEKIISEKNRLKSERSRLNQLWEEVAEVLSPDRRGFTGASAAMDPLGDNYDQSSVIAKRSLVNAIGAMLRPKTAAPGKWFDITTEDENLMEERAVKAWIEHAEERLWTAIYNPKAKFIQATGEADDDVVSFGTAAVFTGVRSDRSGLLFRAFHMKGVYVDINADGDVTTVYIVEELTADQAEGRWGVKNLGAKTQEALRDQSGQKGKKFSFVWCVSPRHVRDPRARNNANMAWQSIVIDEESQHEVIEEGFEEFPFAIPRWDVRSGEKHGRGVGVLALPSVLTLSQMGKTTLRALHRAVEPPVLLPNGAMVNAPQLYPGGVGYYDAAAVRKLGLSNPFVQMESRGNIPWAMDARSQERELVFALFFKNILNLPIDGPDMTAYEVAQRKEEFVREIGAVFGQLEADYTAPMVERAFNLMLRNNGFMPPPDELKGQSVKFRFASPVEKAKAQIEALTVEQGINRIIEVGNIRPEVMNTVNWEAWGKYTAEASDFPTELINDADTIERLGKEQAEQAAMASDMAAAERAAGVASQVAPLVQQ